MIMIILILIVVYLLLYKGIKKISIFDAVRIISSVKKIVNTFIMINVKKKLVQRTNVW